MLARALLFDNLQGRDDAHRLRCVWRSLLDQTRLKGGGLRAAVALPGGEAETQAAVNRPTAGSNPALAASPRVAQATWRLRPLHWASPGTNRLPV